MACFAHGCNSILWADHVNHQQDGPHYLRCSPSYRIEILIFKGFHSDPIPMYNYVAPYFLTFPLNKNQPDEASFIVRDLKCRLQSPCAIAAR